MVDVLEPVRRGWGRLRRWRATGWQRRMRPLKAGFWMLAAAIWGVTEWLLGTADDATAGTDRAKVRVDAVRTGLAAGAGAAAVVTLGLAFRRQEHQEYDTAERRVTELYNAAAEQLGSDKAPVRLTALYTLERLANDNPPHRQTIVNIISAYLRMPFTPPAAEPSGDAGDERRTAARRYYSARAGARAGTWHLASAPAAAGSDPHEELQVRLTAQRILQTHLQVDADVAWTELHLDLTGATLIDFTLTRCTLASATFRGATFTGDADFYRATFTGVADFSGTTFSASAGFRRAAFSGGGNFNQASFSGAADFGYAIFHGRAYFTGVVFAGTAIFSRATFSAGAAFRRAAFSRNADFGQAIFARNAHFHGVSFNSAGDHPGQLMEFTRVPEADLRDATVADAGAGHVLPPGWRVEQDGDGGGILTEVSIA